jgi:hypothetical protein
MEAFNELIHHIHLLVVEPIYHAHHTVAAISTAQPAAMRDRLDQTLKSQCTTIFTI